MIVHVLGGLGLFLLGMIVMGEGLQALAGNAMRAALVRFTSSPFSGAVTGAVSTVILRSSSATTVAAVGFVGAGLLSFTASLGIIFGANIGTTFTGWIVVLLGFEFKIGTMVLPLILVGAVLRLFTTGRLANTGYAIAGFGLIFVGISELQLGMSGLEGVITPDNLPEDTIIGRVMLVFLGIITTVITQSSSAGVAAVLTALYANAINFEQAMALVIGMDIGTTVTAAMATVGASVGARRTGYSHVIYNLFTGTGALLLISPYIFVWEWFAPGALHNHSEIALVAFHTLFNTLGVIIVLPFTARFARMIIRLVPEKMPVYTRKLEPALLQQPGLALSAVQDSIRSEFIVLLGHVYTILSDDKNEHRVDLGELQLALNQTYNYVDSIHLGISEGADWERLIAISHALDHMQRLHERCEEDEDRAITARENIELSTQNVLLTTAIVDIINVLEDNKWQEAAHRAEKVATRIHEHVEPMRMLTIEKIAREEINVSEATDQLEAIRWLKRVSRHIARITYHSHLAWVAAGK